MNAKRLNLIPKDLRHSKKMSFESVLGVLVAVIMAYIVSSFPYLSKTVEKKKNELAMTEAKNNELNIEFADLSKSEMPLKMEDQAFSKYQSLLEARSEWTKVFQELSLLIRDGVWLSEIKTQKNDTGSQLTIVGQALSLSEMAEFFSNLEKSYFFRNVQLKNSELVANLKPSQYKFEFHVEIPKKLKEKNS